MSRTVKFQVRRYSTSGSQINNAVVYAGSAELTADVGGFATIGSSTSNTSTFFWTHFIIVPNACDVRDRAGRSAGSNRIFGNLGGGNYDNVRVIPNDVSFGDAMNYMTGDYATTDPATGKFQDFRVMWVERYGPDSKRVYIARGQTNYPDFGIQ